MTLSSALIAPFARSAEGELVCEGRPIKEMAQEFGTPVFIYSERAIADAFEKFLAAAEKAKPLGISTLICYALKANSSLAIIRLLSRLGAGFDIVSQGELGRVLAASGDPRKAVFSGVGKTTEEIRAALLAQVKCINAESVAELDRISAIAVALGVKAPVSLRVNPDIDPKTHPYISTGLKENKFGVPMSSALLAYQYANGLPGICVKGIDCHIGSQITSLQPFLDSLERVLALADQLAAQGIMIEHLDLGGGLGICYGHETPPSPEELLGAIFSRLHAWSQHNKRTCPEILFEFGRAIVGNAGVLISRVEVLKPGEDKNFAVIDAAMNDLMRPALYDAWHAVEPVSLSQGPAAKRDPSAPKTLAWDLVGPVCETGDWIAKDRNLALMPGDLLAILSAGAYGMSMSSNYNSRPRAAEILVDRNGVAHLIRRREQFEDLIMPERIPEHLQNQ